LIVGTGAAKRVVVAVVVVVAVIVVKNKVTMTGQGVNKFFFENNQYRGRF